MDLLVFLVDSPVISALAKSLLHFLWQGVVIAFGLYLVLNVISKRQSELRYVISLAAMGLCVAVPVSTFFWLYQPVSVMSIEQVSPAVIELFQAQNVTNHAASSWAWFDWNLLLTLTSVIWFVGVIYLSIHLILELISVYKLPNRNVIEPEDEIKRIFDNLKTRLQVNRFTKLLISLQAEVPLVVGFMKPVVLVPFSMASGLSSAQLEMLLAHELAHVKRHDYLINFFQTLASILLFFHPLVKWISLQIRIEREYCCDDIAVHTCGDMKAYATALADAESIRSHHIPQLAMAATGGDLKGRVLRMIEHNDCANKHSRSWHSMVLASLVSISMAVMLFSAHAGYQTRVVEVLHGEIIEQQPLIALDDESLTQLEQIGQVKDENVTVAKVEPDMSQASAPISRDSNRADSDVSASTQAVTASGSVNSTASNAPKAVMSTNEKTRTIIAPEVHQSVSILNEPAFIADDEASKPTTEMVEVAQDAAVSNIESLTSVISDNGQISKYQTALTNTPVLAAAQQKANVDSDVKTSVEPTDMISIVAPSLVRNARPNYPRTAIARNIEADVKVSFLVDKDGRINDIEFEQNVPGYFKRSIRKALKHWRFAPGSIDGKVSEMTLTRIFTFRDPDADVGEETTLRVTGSRISKQI